MVRRSVAVIAIRMLLVGCCALPCAAAHADGVATPQLTEADLVDADRTEARLNAADAAGRVPALDAWLQALVERLAAGATPEGATPDGPVVRFRAHVLERDTATAFALDNGALYASTGLLARLGDEAQLAAFMAPEMAGVMLNQKARSRADATQRARRRLLPDLLLVTATAGLGAIAIGSAVGKANQAEADAMQLEADTLGWKMLRAAGFDSAAGLAGFGRLREQVQAETGQPEVLLASDALFDLSRRGLEASGGAVAAAPAQPATPSAEFRRWQRRALLLVVQHQLGNPPRAANALLDWQDRCCGTDGALAFLRAEVLRLGSRDAARWPAVAAAYRAATAHEDAPAIAWRELGLAQRRAGEAAESRAALATYLQRAPGAVDAPIIASYIKED